jgi:enoyl-CoA hydratase/carnithine racemase
MKKFVRAFGKVDLTAMLFLIAYGKRFSAGTDIDAIVKRFNAKVKASKIDTRFERGVMASLYGRTE